MTWINPKVIACIYAFPSQRNWTCFCLLQFQLIHDCIIVVTVFTTPWLTVESAEYHLLCFLSCSKAPHSQNHSKATSKVLFTSIPLSYDNKPLMSGGNKTNFKMFDATSLAQPLFTNYSCSITGIWQQVPNALLFPPFLWVTSPSWERQRHKMRTGVFPDDQIFLESSLVSSQRAFTRNFTQKYIDSLASGGKIYGIINARAPGLSMKVFSGHASAAKYAV